MTKADREKRGPQAAPPNSGRAFRYLTREIHIWLPAAIICLLLASILKSGWPDGLIPNLSIPYSYAGDALSHSWLIRRVIEGNWYFDNERSGYPFGSDFLDYPGSDAGNFLLLKIIGTITGAYPATLNLYFLLGFPMCFVCAYAVLRAFSLSRWGAVSGAALFTFLPFHFLRLDHLFYTWYFTVPIFFHYGWRIYGDGGDTPRKPRFSARFFAPAGAALLLMACACFGVYYALFGVIVLAGAGLAGAVRRRSPRPLLLAVAACAAVSFGVLLNLAPNIMHARANGPNTEAAHTSIAGAETYGLKLAQLVLPYEGHRLRKLREVTQLYNQKAPLVNENKTAALGLAGSAGFLTLLACLFAAGAGAGGDSRPTLDPRLAFLAVTTALLFLFATIGGFSSLFSLVVSPAIRGWNRASVFIGFSSLAALFIAAEFAAARLAPRIIAKAAVARLPPRGRLTDTLPAAFALMLLAAGLWDQTFPACKPCNDDTRAAYQSDRAFIRDIESRLPPGAAVYQLPYMAFPEVPPLHKLGAYDHASGFLHSRALKWSYGGMKGRPGDLFFRDLAARPMQEQIAAVRNLGFSGIYIDRRGYADNGAAIEKELSALLGGGPALESEIRAFFILPGAAPVLPAGLRAEEILDRAGALWQKRKR